MVASRSPKPAGGGSSPSAPVFIFRSMVYRIGAPVYGTGEVGSTPATPVYFLLYKEDK